MLFLLFFLNLICISGIIIIGFFSTFNIYEIKKTALYISVLIFIGSLGFLGLEHKIIFFKGVSFIFDSLSISLVILSTMLIPICILSSWESINYRIKDFLLLLFLVELLLLNVFFITNILIFYILFESILIPMFLIIGVWGSRERKIHAAYQFFFYTLFSSFFVLLSIVYILNSTGNLEFPFLCRLQFSGIEEYLFWLAFFFAFATKIPMIPVHIWLPEAHVEAPTAGSVLLAGVLLKLGGYGIIRYLLPLFPNASLFFTPFILSLAVIGIIYGSLTTLRQIDLKKIIAYSSIAHMNYVVVGLFSSNILGIEGSIFLMLSHGIVSSGLFLCVGFLYDRYGTRLLHAYSGLSTIMPNFSIFFFFFLFANLSLPGTSSFVGEFLVIQGTALYNSVATFLCCFGVIPSAAYNVWLFNRLCFGILKLPIASNVNFYDLNKREFLLLLFLLILIFWLGIYPNFFLNFLENNVYFIIDLINR